MALESETKLLIAEEDQIIAMKAAVVVGALAVHKVQSNKFVIRRRQLQLKSVASATGLCFSAPGEQQIWNQQSKWPLFGAKHTNQHNFRWQNKHRRRNMAR